MLEYFTLILICQLIGELVVSFGNIPLPGPVIGMMLLFLFLCIKNSVPRELEKVSSALLENLSLMFVPAGVGIMAHFELLGTNALPLSVAIVVSTLVTIAVTALLMQTLNKRHRVDPPATDS